MQKRLHVRVRYESNRLEQTYLVDAYAFLVPIKRCRLKAVKKQSNRFEKDLLSNQEETSNGNGSSLCKSFIR